MNQNRTFKNIAYSVVFASVFLLLSYSYASGDNPENDIQTVQKHYGLAMHGTPKYDDQAAYLDYANPSAPKGEHFKRSAIGTFDTLNPFSIKGKSAQGLNVFYDRLMGRVWDEPFTMYPLIAKSYAIADDRSWISFMVNPDARFHDGTAITVDDVLFSYKTLKDNGRPNMRQIYKLVQSVETPEQDTIMFRFGDGYDQETALILAMMPVLSKAYWQDKEFDSTTLDIPVSSGPYKIESFDVGHAITYKRDPNYWARDLLINKGHHNFDRITYDYYRDASVAFEAFGSRQLDLRLENDLARWREGYDFDESGDLTIEPIAHQRPEKTIGMIFNTRRAPFDDIRVRKAMSLLFDAEKINELIYNGTRKRIDSYYPNSELAASFVKNIDQKDEPKTPHNTRQAMRDARALLRDAGWVIDNGRMMKDGAEFAFELLVSSADDEKIALYFKRYLDRLGIKLVIRSLDRSAFIDRARSYDYDMVVYHWRSSLSPGTEQILYWGCDAKDQQGRWNYAGICDPDIDQLSLSMPQATTREGLVNTARALDQKLLGGVYMIPLFYEGADHYAYWAPVQRPETTPIYGAVLETWWMKPSVDEK